MTNYSELMKNVDVQWQSYMDSGQETVFFSASDYPKAGPPQPELFERLRTAAGKLGAKVSVVDSIDGGDADARCHVSGRIEVLRKLEPTEAAGRLAHELGHWLVDYAEPRLTPFVKELSLMNPVEHKAAIAKAGLEKYLEVVNFVESTAPLPVKETRAEAVSYLVLKHFGVEQPRSVGFIASWGGNSKRLAEFQNQILATAAKIVAATEAA